MVDADYLVVGAGAAGMAFTDALIDHADVSVVLVDRRHSVGGHWLDAYPFVRLHQASAFYGVASTVLGDRRIQSAGPEAGLYERASAAEVCAYYERVLRERLLASGKVSFRPNCDYLGDGRLRSRLTGRTFEVGARTRIVDARYLAPEIPATTRAPFAVADGARVVAVNDLVDLGDAPAQYVVVGSGKTATDACIWLLDNGVGADAICWVRPRDPWMLNRAVVQPDPAVFIGMGADILEAATEASTPDDLFLRLEEFGVMLRIDRSVTPTMARTPTLASWELDRLRTIENVVRRGHVECVEPGRIVLAQGEVATPRDAVVVHCAASGLQSPPMVPIWQPEVITLQLIRAGFPCFAAALAGYVEATVDDDGEKNRLCPPSPYSSTPADWARMQVLGNRAVMSYSGHPDISAWANGVALNPARIPPESAGSPELTAAVERFRMHVGAGMTRLAVLAGRPEAAGRPRDRSVVRPITGDYGPTMSAPLRVVFADDNYLVREGVGALLAEIDGIDLIATVADPKALLAAVAEHRPDAVLTDIRMPPTHTNEGILAAKRIRSENPGIGVVVLSQYVEEEYAFELLSDGVAGMGYLLKERVTDLDELSRALREVARGGSALDPKVVEGLLARKGEQARSPLLGLTDRERDVLEQMATGRNNSMIAKTLFMSERAVEKHISSVFQKLGLVDEGESNRRVMAVLAFLEATTPSR